MILTGNFILFVAFLIVAAIICLLVWIFAPKNIKNFLEIATASLLILPGLCFSFFGSTFLFEGFRIKTTTTANQTISFGAILLSIGFIIFALVIFLIIRQIKIYNKNNQAGRKDPEKLE